MPYSTKTTAACPISQPWGVIKDGTAQVMGCHASESDANQQIAALYASEDIERAKYDDIDFSPPEGVQEEAAKGLEWRQEYNRGGTAVGVARARDLSNGKSVSPETIRRMVSYFARHEVDKKGEGWSPGEDGFPSAGRIAWALWGGDPGQAWSAKVSRSMDARDKAERISKMPRIKRYFENVKDGRAVIATETPIEIYDETRGWLSQVLLMDGVQFRNDKRQLPIVDSHNDKTVRNVFGSIRNIRIEGDKLIGDADFASDEDSQIVATRYEEGHLNDFSIDAVIIERKYLREGEQYVTTSGTVINGPAEIVTRWEPHNASICATGADPNSTVRRSYNQKDIERMDEALMEQLKALGLPEGMEDPMAIITWMADHMKPAVVEVESMVDEKKVENMQDEEMPKVESMDQKVAEEVARQLKAEKVRRETIYNNVKLARLERSFADQLIDEGVSVAVANERIIRKMATQPLGQSNESSAHIAVTESSDEKLAAAMSAGLIKRAFKNAKIKAKAEDAPGSNDFANLNLRRLASYCVQRMGITTDRMTDAEIARLAMGSPGAASRYRVQRDAYHTTGSFPNLLLDAANKTLRQAYEEAPYTWSLWARQAASVDDFKNINRISFGESPNLEMVPEAQEYKEKSISDSKTSYKVEKYGAIFTISWETVINDDLDAISRVPAMHGNAARRVQNKAVYDILFTNPTMSDGQSLFSASHASGRNTNSTTAALNVTLLNEMFSFMMLQKGQSSDAILNITPRYLLVPAALSATALELVNSQSYAQTGGNEGVTNIYGVNGQRPLTVVVEPLIDGHDNGAYYLAADTSQIDTVELSFLNGEEAPVLESDLHFETDTYRYKVRQTFGAAAIDWRGLSRCT
jgi:hypothetical protein